MLGLQRGDAEFFDLTENARIDVTGSNPAFDSALVARVFSYPFRLPASPLNLRLLKSGNRLDAQQGQPSADATLWAAGSPFAVGKVTVREASATSIECHFGNPDRELIDLLGSVKIRDLMPSVDIPQTVTAAWDFDTPPTGGPMEIVINGTTISYDGTGEDGNTAAHGLEAAINAVFSGTAFVSPPTGPSSGGILTLTAGANDPFSVLEVSGLTLVSSTTVSEAAMQNLLDYIESTFDTPVDSHSFPVLHHVNLYGDANPEFEDFVNYWLDGTFGENVPMDTKAWEYTWIPYVAVKYVFDAIATELDFAWTGTLYETGDFAALRILSNYTLDQPRQEYFSGEQKWINGGAKSFALSKAVPDLTAQEFLSQVCEFFNLYIQRTENTLTLHKRKAQFGTPWEIEQMLPDYNIVRKEARGVTLRFTADAEDLTGDLDTYVIGAGGTEIETELSPLQDREVFNNPATTTWQMCQYFAKTGEDVSNGAASTAPFRLFFDRGVQQNTDGLEYHMSTRGDTNMDGDTIGDLRLEWDGDTGLYAQLWAGWAELADKEQLEMTAVLTVADARRMLRWEDPVVRFYHPEGTTRAIVKTIQFDISVETGEYLRAKLEMLKL